MLAGDQGRISDLCCPIVNPGVQIEIKEMFPKWCPDLPVREKHREDVERLRETLGQRTGGV